MPEFWSSLKCIRCGACMNTCPVYRRSGGLSYGAVYAGPIGAIINPTFDVRKFANLPFASTLNGSCTNVCPVKINIHEQLYQWRRVVVEQGYLPLIKRLALRLAGFTLARPRLWRLSASAARTALNLTPRWLLYNPLNVWGRHRDLPKPKESFRDWYLKNRERKS